MNYKFTRMTKVSRAECYSERGSIIRSSRKCIAGVLFVVLILQGDMPLEEYLNANHGNDEEENEEHVEN